MDKEYEKRSKRWLSLAEFPELQLNIETRLQRDILMTLEDLRDEMVNISAELRGARLSS